MSCNETCGECRHWSELVAQAISGTCVVEALCEHPTGPKASQMTRETDSCEKWDGNW